MSSSSSSVGSMEPVKKKGKTHHNKKTKQTLPIHGTRSNVKATAPPPSPAKSTRSQTTVPKTKKELALEKKEAAAAKKVAREKVKKGKATAMKKKKDYAIAVRLEKKAVAEAAKAKKKASKLPRGPNITPEEDLLICKVIVNLTHNSILGTDQRTALYWGAVGSKFRELMANDANKTINFVRSDNAIKNRYQRHLSKGAQLFNGFYK